MEETTYHHIENYLEGNLPKEELAAFETRLQNDAELAQKVTLFKELADTLGDPVRQNIQAQLNILGVTYFQQTAVAKKKINHLPFYQRPWVMAASFLLLISVGFLFWQNQSATDLSNEEIFALNYKAPNLEVMTRGEGAENALQEAIQLYKKQEYTAALVKLKILQQADPQNQQLSYLIGHSYLNQSPPNLVAASDAFKALIKHKENVYVHKAQWYLGLIYIQQNEIEAAKPLLQAVIDANDNNRENAKKILVDL